MSGVRVTGRLVFDAMVQGFHFAPDSLPLTTLEHGPPENVVEAIEFGGRVFVPEAPAGVSGVTDLAAEWLAAAERIDGIASQATTQTAHSMLVGEAKIYRHCAAALSALSLPSSEAGERWSQPSAINESLLDFARRWEHDGDYLRCTDCHRPQIASQGHNEFRHAPDCKAGAVELRPWETLVAILRPAASATVGLTAAEREGERWLLMCSQSGRPVQLDVPEARALLGLIRRLATRPPAAAPLTRTQRLRVWAWVLGPQLLGAGFALAVVGVLFWWLT